MTKTYIQIDDLGNGHYNPCRIKENPNYSRIRLIINEKQVDGCDCPTSELLQSLQMIQTRSYNLIVPKKE